MPSWPGEAGEGVAAGTRPGPLPGEAARQTAASGGEGGSQAEQPGRRDSRADVETPIPLSSDVNRLSPARSQARREPLARSLPANHLGLTLGGEGPRVNARGHEEDLQHPISLKYQAAWQKSAIKFSWVYDTRAILCYLV